MSIFISYSRQDSAYVKKLIRELERQELPYWLDDSIDYSTSWLRVIERNLRSCEVFVLVMSPRAEESHWVENELLLALELKKPIFPLLLEGDRWFAVTRFQIADVRGGELPPSRFFERVRGTLSQETLTSQVSVSAG